jgi:hypothetical protein
MEVDEYPPARQPQGAKRRCNCCGKLLGARQIARHRAQLLERLNAALVAGDLGVNNGGGPARGNDIDIDMEDNEDVDPEGEYIFCSVFTAT